MTPEEITYRDSLLLKKPVYVDVRSPGEYSHDHIPGSVNIPLFSDSERAEIGTIYRHAGQSEAIIRGTEIVSPRVGEFVSFVQKNRTCDVIISCARGGMRSGSLAALLNSLGYPVKKLAGGYKGYRRYVIEELDSFVIKPRVFLLQGLTGTGKTEILKSITNSVDLEGMAGHRSSVYGGIGLSQNSQKRFESLLLKKLHELQNEDYMMFEAESRKIGNTHIPAEIFPQMRKGKAIRIVAPMKRRVDILFREYTPDYDKNQIIRITRSISGKIGKKNTDRLIELLENDDIRGFIQLLLEKYYDPLYEYSIEKMSYIGEIENLDTKTAVDRIMSLIESYSSATQ